MPKPKLDTKLETATGPAYCVGEEIVMVGAPWRKPGQPETFAVGLRSGHTIHAIENPANMETLKKCAEKGFIQWHQKPIQPPAPATDSTVNTPQTAAPKRGRGRPRKPPIGGPTT